MRGAAIAVLFLLVFPLILAISNHAWAKGTCSQVMAGTSDQPVINSIRFYETEGANVPFDKWFSKLKNVDLQNRIIGRLKAFAAGQPGDSRTLSQSYVGRHSRSPGVHIIELRFSTGHRLYLGNLTSKEYIVLMGGTKDSQRIDTSRAFNLMRQLKHSQH